MQMGGFFFAQNGPFSVIIWLKIWLKANLILPLPSNSQFSNCGYLGVEAILVRRLTKKT
jgi:hypothetical protein